MFAKVLAILLILAPCQVVISMPIRHANEVGDKMQNIACSIENAIENANMEVANVKEKFESDLQEGNDNINKQMSRFEEMLQEASQSCESDGKDIANCQRDAKDAMESLDKSAVNNCLPKNELVKVEKSLEDLEMLKKECPSKCSKLNSEGMFRRCRHREEIDAQSEVSEEMSSIEVGLKTAMSDFDKCVNTALKQFSDAAEKIADDFSKCYNSL